jgi:branched-chain amino acid transport system substrate-binding protein
MIWSRLGAQLLCALVLLAALPARAADEPYDFYAILSLTGPAAFLGHAEEIALNGFEKAINSSAGIHGRPLHAIVEDDQSAPATAVQLATVLVAKHVPIIFGPALSSTALAIEPLVAANGPVIYAMTNAIHPARGGYTFSAGLSNQDNIAGVLRFWKAKGVRKVALLTSTDASGQDGEALSLADLKLPEFKDMQLVANEHFGISDLTVSAQVSRIKAAGAQAIDVWTTGTPFGTVLRAVNETGFDGWVMSNTGNMNPAQMKQYASFIPEKLIFIATPYLSSAFTDPRILKARADFEAAMRGVGVTTPEAGNVLAWDPLLVLGDALRHLNPDPTAMQVRDYLLTVRNFPGIQGFYDFTRGADQRGVSASLVLLARWDPAGGTFVPITRPGGLPL